MRATRLEVNVDTFKENVNKIKEFIPGKEIMPVLKAHAYGTYLNKRLDILNLFKIVAVALVDEGIEIRKTGYKGDIFVLNQPSIDEIDSIEKYDLTIGLSDLSFLEECVKRESKMKVHIEIETGMNRTGVKLEELEDFLNVVHTSTLNVVGIYSHFSSADFDDTYTSHQIDIFEKAYQLALDEGFVFQYVHISASNGLLKYNLPFTNLVRPGIILYGFESYPGCLEEIDLKPVCRYVTKITFLKQVKEGEKIGYSQNFTCLDDTNVATIPVGYGDGFRRIFSNQGYVFIRGKKAPIIGNVCMDSCMVDTTGINCQVGDEVVLFDQEHISLEELSRIANTINYELLCTIGERVPRVFNDEKSQ